MTDTSALAKTDLRSLIGALEVAKEGSRELDREIHNTRADRLPISAEELAADERLSMFILSYTTSLDAALSLVPEGRLVHLRQGEYRERIVWWCELHQQDLSRDLVAAHFVKTAALALCIAALKARAAPDTQG